jgi:hypothetical protein
LNPIIYTLRNKDIMVALRQLITTLSTWAKPLKFRNIILLKKILFLCSSRIKTNILSIIHLI